MSPLTESRRPASASESLDRETELRLATAWKEHQDEAAASRLVQAHMRYVVATAVKYRRYGVPLDELIAEGNFGLVHALRKFEPERGFRFVTYAAYWIRAYILNYIIRSWSLVGSGSGVLRSKMFFRLRRERVKLANLLGDRDAAEEALADKLGTSREQLSNMLRRLESRDVSLDGKVFDDGSTTLLDTLVAKNDGQDQIVYEGETRGEVKAWVRTAMQNLDRRERFIVEQRLMADAEEKLSLAEIGRTLGVSRERARQLEARAKNKLKARLLLEAKGPTLDVLREELWDQRTAA
jgi:RNA polymerase sigma-32 factor